MIDMGQTFLSAIEIEKKIWANTRTLGYTDFLSGVISLNISPHLSNRVRRSLDKVSDPALRAKYLQNELRNSSNKQEYINGFITMFHELRHWHDYLGTSLGFEIFWSYSQYISRMSMALRKIATTEVQFSLPFNLLKLPIQPHVKEFEEFIRTHNNLFNYKFSHIKNPMIDVRKLRQFTRNKAMMLNDVPFIFKNDLPIIIDVPLTGLALLEASAVLTETYFIYDTFGEIEANVNLHKYDLPELWVYNSVINSLKKTVPGITADFMLAIVSHSLIYPIGIKVNTSEKHPVIRFKAFLSELERAPFFPKTQEDINGWINKVYEVNRWVNLNQISNERINFCNDQIQEVSSCEHEEDRELDVFEEYMIYYLRKHQHFFTVVQNDPLFWAHNYFYSDLPEPQVVNISTPYNKRLIGEDVTPLNWFFLTNILGQLTNGKKKDFVCPVKNTSQCAHQTKNCGTLPMAMPPDHPECWCFCQDGFEPLRLV